MFYFISSFGTDRIPRKLCPIHYLIKLIVDTDHRRLSAKMELIFTWCNYVFVCLSSCSIKMRKYNFKLIWWLELFPRLEHTYVCVCAAHLLLCRSASISICFLSKMKWFCSIFFYGEWIKWMENDDRIKLVHNVAGCVCLCFVALCVNDNKDLSNWWIFIMRFGCLCVCCVVCCVHYLSNDFIFTLFPLT